MTARLSALLLLVGAGCVSVRYSRERTDEPVPEEAVAQLVPGTGLGRCLELIGPPRLVWKDPRGIWLAYIWIDERGPSIGVSVPLDVLLVSPRVRYSNTRRRGEGIVLLFDDDLRLQFVRRGLSDLPPEELGMFDAMFG